jgi:hypothetical protein
MYQKAQPYLSKTIFTILLFLTTAIGNSLPKKDPSAVPKNFILHYENRLGTSFEMRLPVACRQHGATADKTALNEIKRFSKIGLS